MVYASECLGTPRAKIPLFGLISDMLSITHTVVAIRTDINNTKQLLTDS